MGSFCTSSPSKQTTSQTQSYQADPRVAAAGEQTLNMAQGAASQPFQMPAAPVAGFNPFQTQSFNQYQGMQGGLQPYFQNAGADMTQAQSPVTQADTASYMNPFRDQALADMKKYIFDPQRTQAMGQATQAAGGVGADRLALTSQNLDKTQADALGQAESGFYGQAMGQAQRSKEMALQSAQGWANLGLGNQTGQLQATGALAGAGAQQQQQSQRELMSPYEQTLARIAYPMQQASFLSGITGNMSNVFRGTTSGQGTTMGYQPQPSMFNMIAGGAGIGTAIAGMSGAFGGGGMQGSNGLGSDVANNGSGMYTGDASYPGFGNRGGNVDAFADGGEVENPWDLYGTGHQTASNFNTPTLDLNPKQPQSSQSSSGGAGDAMKMAQMAMMFMKRGGSVNPWDMAHGFAPGGDVEEYSQDEYNPIDDKLARPIEGPAPDLGMWPFNRGQADAQGNVTMFPQAEEKPPGPLLRPGSPLDRIFGGSGAQAAPARTPSAAPANPYGMPPDAGRLPFPGSSPPPAIPSPIPQPTRVAQAPDRGGGYGPRPGSINSDMKISDFMEPRGEQPYPDALNRDWGQKAARSPWMSLLHAGAKMAQSTKSGIAGLAEGVEAGATHLDTQRKELRSEQQINQKAEELYRHARSELNKYTRKTPHELATERHHELSLAQGRFQPINYPDPVTGQLRLGNYDAKRGILIDSVTRQPVTDAVRLLGRNAGLPMTEAQIEAAGKNRFVNEPGKYKSIEEAKEAVRKDVQAAQSHGASQPGSTAESAIPDPGDGNRVSGTWYINPATGKPDRWR